MISWLKLYIFGPLIFLLGILCMAAGIYNHSAILGFGSFLWIAIGVWIWGEGKSEALGERIRVWVIAIMCAAIGAGTLVVTLMSGCNIKAKLSLIAFSFVFLSIAWVAWKYRND